MNKLEFIIIMNDYSGLWRVCGPRVALRWLVSVARNLKAIIWERNLQPADRAMGAGPYFICFPDCATAFRETRRADQSLFGDAEG